MAFARRARPLAEQEKCADEQKARERALEMLAAQELSSGLLYERLCRRFTGPAAAAAVADMVRLDYVNDGRYAEAKAHALLSAHKSRRAAAAALRQKGLDKGQISSALDKVYAQTEEDGEPELAAACALAAGHYRSKLAAGRADLVVAALQRRGFSWATAREAVRRAGAENAGQSI